VPATKLVGYILHPSWPAIWIRAREPEDAAALLQTAGVSAMPVQGPEEHRADSHLAARGAFVRVVHPEKARDTAPDTDEPHAHGARRVRTGPRHAHGGGADRVLGLTEVEALVAQGGVPLTSKLMALRSGPWPADLPAEEIWYGRSGRHEAPGILLVLTPGCR
jgi:hypothetical protein